MFHTFVFKLRKKENQKSIVIKPPLKSVISFHLVDFLWTVQRRISFELHDELQKLQGNNKISHRLSS